MSRRPHATGTSQDLRDAWFVGYTAHLVAGVWLGNDDNSPTRKAVGGGLPVEIWSRFSTCNAAMNSVRLTRAESSCARGAPTSDVGQQSDPRSGRPARAGWAALRQFRFWGERSIMRPPRRRASAASYGVIANARHRKTSSVGQR